jgi:hypothetical protein
MDMQWSQSDAYDQASSTVRDTWSELVTPFIGMPGCNSCVVGGLKYPRTCAFVFEVLESSRKM